MTNENKETPIFTNAMKKEKSMLLIEKVKAILEKDGFKVIPNYKTGYKGKYIRINLVAINKKGVYLITVKNVNAVITGNYKDKVWFSEYPEGKVFKMPNTMKALYVSQKAIMSILKEFDMIRPLTTTIFGDEAVIAIKNAHPFSILKINDMDRFFKSSKFKERLTDDEVDRIYKTLLKKNVEDKDVAKREDACL